MAKIFPIAKQDLSFVHARGGIARQNPGNAAGVFAQTRPDSAVARFAPAGKFIRSLKRQIQPVSRSLSCVLNNRSAPKLVMIAVE